MQSFLDKVLQASDIVVDLSILNSSKALLEINRSRSKRQRLIRSQLTRSKLHELGDRLITQLVILGLDSPSSRRH